MLKLNFKSFSCRMSDQVCNVLKHSLWFSSTGWFSQNQHTININIDFYLPRNLNFLLFITTNVLTRTSHCLLPGSEAFGASRWGTQFNKYGHNYPSCILYVFAQCPHWRGIDWAVTRAPVDPGFPYSGKHASYEWSDGWWWLILWQLFLY